MMVSLCEFSLNKSKFLIQGLFLQQTSLYMNLNHTLGLIFFSYVIGSNSNNGFQTIFLNSITLQNIGLPHSINMTTARLQWYGPVR